MARKKRIFREWQHPRDDRGRFAKKGGAAWAARAMSAYQAVNPAAFSMAQPGLAEGTPGGVRMLSVPKRKGDKTTGGGVIDTKALSAAARTAFPRKLPTRVDTPHANGQGGAMASTTPAKRTAYDQLFDPNGPSNTTVKHRQTRQLLEQMEMHGWKLTGQNGQVETTEWAAPDGRKLSIQFITRDKPKVYGERRNESLTFKAAMERVVTPKLEPVSGPRVPEAMERAGLKPIPASYEYNKPRDPMQKPLEDAQQAMGAKGMYGGQGKSAAEAAEMLRQSAARYREAAATADRLYGFGSVRDSKSEERERHAAEFERVADELLKMDAEHKAYRAEVERRKTLPLDIRESPRSAKPAKKAAAKPAIGQASDRIGTQRGEGDGSRMTMSEVDAELRRRVNERKAAGGPSSLEVAQQGFAKALQRAMGEDPDDVGGGTSAPVGGVDLTKPSTLPEAPKPGAAGYASMGRPALLAMARMAEVDNPGRKSNTELAEALAAKDEQKRAGLNPSGIGQTAPKPKRTATERQIDSLRKRVETLRNRVDAAQERRRAKGSRIQSSAEEKARNDLTTAQRELDALERQQKLATDRASGKLVGADVLEVDEAIRVTPGNHREGEKAWKAGIRDKLSLPDWGDEPLTNRAAMRVPRDQVRVGDIISEGGAGLAFQVAGIQRRDDGSVWMYGPGITGRSSRVFKPDETGEVKVWRPGQNQDTTPLRADEDDLDLMTRRMLQGFEDERARWEAAERVRASRGLPSRPFRGAAPKA